MSVKTLEKIKELINQLETEEKEELAEYLDDEVLFKQLEEVQSKLKDIPLTFEEITEEVEKVRIERFKKGKR